MLILGKMAKTASILSLLAVIATASAQSYLTADGSSDTYTLLNNFLGNNAIEVPDCAHDMKHIWQGNDGNLNRQVFYFHSHVNEDNDRCMNYDRQRTEIKSVKSNLYGSHGETLSLSWNFKLDAGFQPSTSFTHLHQLKAVGGNEKQPIITITARKASPNTIQIIHINGDGTTTYLGSTPLAPFLGTWVHVQQEATFWQGGGYYKVKFTRESDGATLYSLEKSNIEMWRPDNSYVRPKWGIYRSLNDKGSLRDETVRFDTFCFAKGANKCN